MNTGYRWRGVLQNSRSNESSRQKLPRLLFDCSDDTNSGFSQDLADLERERSILCLDLLFKVIIVSFEQSSESYSGKHSASRESDIRYRSLNGHSSLLRPLSFDSQYAFEMKISPGVGYA